MSPSRPVAIALGAVLGAVCVTVGIALAPAAEADTESDPDDAPSPADVWWHDPAEVFVGPSAVIVESIGLDDTAVVITFRVETAASAPRGTPTWDWTSWAVPYEWVLILDGVEHRQHTDRHDAGQVRFDVGRAVEPAQITGLRIDAYRERLPYRWAVSLPPVVGLSMRLDDEVTITVASVFSQVASTMVGFDIERPVGLWASGSGSGFVVRGLDPRWSDPGPRSAGAGAAEAWQISWPGAQPPEMMAVEIVGSRWIHRDASVTIPMRRVVDE